MAIDHRVGTKIQKNLRAGDAPATRVDPYPHIGIVKNNFDPTRTGRLQVWIPEFGSKETDPAGWQTVSYTSPFMGTTNIANADGGHASNTNSFENVSHTYGMWMVPPDVGVEIICIFINGDQTRGYWIGCINSNQSRYMLPGLAGSTNVDTANTNPSDPSSTYKAGDAAPVAEFNELQKNSTLQSKRPIHEAQYAHLKKQGLEKDNVRGAGSSSSQREAPSNVFGISTPGRPYTKDPADNINAYKAKILSGKLTAKDVTYKTRKGGHSFVMDDGAATGADQLTRIKTANGHQLLMHDTANSVYLSHADGTSWIELTHDGKVKIYAENGIDMHTAGSFNICADADVNIEAGKNINVKAGGTTKINSVGTVDILSQNMLHLQSATALSLKSGAQLQFDSGALISMLASGTIALTGSTIKNNSGGTQAVNDITEIPVFKYANAKFAGGIYTAVANAITSIVNSAPPTHEPYARIEPSNKLDIQGITNAKLIRPASQNATRKTETKQYKTLTEPAAYKQQNDLTTSQETALQTIDESSKATDSDLRRQPTASFTVGNLSTDDITAYLAQMGRSESSSNYKTVNSIGYVGKYQLGYTALQDLGYVSKSVTSNAALAHKSVWIHHNGINSRADFLNNPAIQEQAMREYTKCNYSTLAAKGGITAEQSKSEIAGMLSAAHLIGATGASNWRKGVPGTKTNDQNNTTAAQYFQRGKYAVEILSPKLPAINLG